MTTPATEQTVWVTEVSHFSGVPKVEKYQLVRVGEHSITVYVRGYMRVFREATGRKWFMNEQAMLDYCTACVQRALDQHRRAVTRLGELLASGVIEIHTVPAEARVYQPIKLEE